MRLLLAVLVALAAGCGQCASTPAASKRRMETARLEMCVQDNPCSELHRCFIESEARCLDAGMERGCGEMEREGSCGINVK